MRLKILIIFTLFNILIPIKSSAERMSNVKFENISTDDGLSNEDVTSIFQDSKSYMWIVTKDGLDRYDGKTMRIYNCNNKYKNSLSSTYISDVEEDLYENIWVATDCGLDFIIKNTDTIIRMRDIGDKSQDNKDENIIWMGGIGTGLIKYHKQKGVIDRYIYDYLDKNSLINDYINCMFFDNLGNLWIGTNIGLSKFDIKIKQFIYYTTAKGLTNNFINSIVVDNNGYIWISTNRGLNKYDAEKDEFRNYIKVDDLYGHQFNLNSSLRLKNGLMIFGSTEGYTYFNPYNIYKYKSYKNEVVIGDIYIEQNRVAYDVKELALNHNYKHFYINYFLPNYESLNNITYEYMLEGIDSDWIYIDYKSNLNLKPLEPGKYTLKIRAMYGRGDLTKETSMNIRVKKTICKTPLAYLICISIILVFAIYIFSYVNILRRSVNKKTMKLNKQLEENKRLSEEIIASEKFKNNYFVNLSHELRTPINIIVSTVQLINSFTKDKANTQEKINEYMNIIIKSCDSLLKIISDIIDSSKIETGEYKIYKKNNDIVYLAEETALNMSKFIETNGISLVIDPDIEEKTISCDATEIERCIINLLGNAVKFTPEGGEIRLHIREVEDYIEISVEDTGIGISKEDQDFIFKRFSQVEDTGATKASSSGIGLTLVKHIVELHGGYIRLESELNKGSKFTIGIPDVLECTEDNN